jgi:hypothetical protein
MQFIDDNFRNTKRPSKEIETNLWKTWLSPYKRIKQTDSQCRRNNFFSLLLAIQLIEEEKSKKYLFTTMDTYGWPMGGFTH